MSHLRVALSGWIETKGHRHEYTLRAKLDLAYSLSVLGERGEAIYYNTQVLKILQESPITNHYGIMEIYYNLAANHCTLGNLHRAEQLIYQNFLALRETKEPPEGLLLSTRRLRARLQEATRLRAIPDGKLTRPITGRMLSVSLHPAWNPDFKAHTIEEAQDVLLEAVEARIRAELAVLAQQTRGLSINQDKSRPQASNSKADLQDTCPAKKEGNPEQLERQKRRERHQRRVLEPQKPGARSRRLRCNGEIEGLNQGPEAKADNKGRQPGTTEASTDTGAEVDRSEVTNDTKTARKKKVDMLQQDLDASWVDATRIDAAIYGSQHSRPEILHTVSEELERRGRL